MTRNTPEDERKTRLAQALRANLKRRKAQARARALPDTVPSAPADSAGSLPQTPPKGSPES